MPNYVKLYTSTNNTAAYLPTFFFIWICEKIWQGVWGQPMVPCEPRARSCWEVQGQSPLPKTILRLLCWFLGVFRFLGAKSQSKCYSTEFTTTWLTIFLQKKINIKLKYFLGKFGNSRESNSCPGSLVKGQNYWGSGRNQEHWYVCAPYWKACYEESQGFHFVAPPIFFISEILIIDWSIT